MEPHYHNATPVLRRQKLQPRLGPTLFILWNPQERQCILALEWGARQREKERGRETQREGGGEQQQHQQRQHHQQRQIHCYPPVSEAIRDRREEKRERAPASDCMLVSSSSVVVVASFSRGRRLAAKLIITSRASLQPSQNTLGPGGETNRTHTQQLCGHGHWPPTTTTKHRR